MRFSKYILCIILLFCLHSGFSQIVTVTSKDDSGPGTLRQALLEVPALTPGYTINFNLPGDPTDYSNRTIRLRSQLPTVPSNVIIDGSSQANWPVLGVSGAKVILEPEYANTTFNGLVIGQYYLTGTQTSGVEIYGLYIRNFAKITSLQSTPSGGSGIVIDYRANNIKIGAPGKGNVLSGNINGIVVQNSSFYSIYAKSSITIQSNLIGIIYDGLSANSNVNGINASLYDCDLIIGGDNAGDGNVISANQINVNVSRSSYSSTVNRFEINIVNNKIGTDYTGTVDYHELPLFLSSSSLQIYGAKIDALYTSLYMRNNVISGNRTWGVSITNADFILTGNSIGTGKNGTEKLGNGGGIKIESNGGGTIGGTTPAEANLIGYNGYGIESISTKAVKITRNSMFCNTVFGIGKALNSYQPFVQILKKRADYISGRATANSEVELFYTQNCEGFCEGRTYFKTVQAGADGRWEYSGALNGSVTATASLLNATTSQFSNTALLDNEALVVPVTCNGNGSITIPEPREGFTFTWNKIINNGTRVYINSTQQITGQEVGTYEVIIDDGCKATSQLFEIKDQKLTDIIPGPIPSRACGQTSFSFSVSVLRGSGTIQFQWKDAAGGIVGNTSGNTSTVTLPEGTYSVIATDAAGCTKPYTFAEIKRKPKPIININTRVMLNASCGQQNGSIKTITVTDVTGTPSYKWYSYNTTTNTIISEVSSSKELENKGSGWYVFEVTDGGECSPVQSSPMQIGENKSVIISYSTNNIKQTTCDQDNGSISNITITEADTYELTGPNGLRRPGFYTGSVLNFLNLPQGGYRLTALNSVTGCNDAINFTVSAIPKTVYSYTVTPVNTTCGLINGSITVRFAGNTPLPTSYTWADASGNPVLGSTYSNGIITLPKLPAGTYTMSVIDVNGCPDTFPSQIITATEVLSINNSPIPPTNDGCSLSRGSILGLSGRGGILPYSYNWYNEAGEIIRSNQATPDLIGIPAGKYHMVLKDATPCGEATSNIYVVENPSFPIATPVVNGLRVCYAMEIMISVAGPEEGTYQLYKDATDATPIMESTKGIFIFKVSKTGEYQIRRKLGTCYSEFKTILIEVTNDNLQVMNTITPNGDGMNDTWIINGLPESGDINIKLYSRSGQLVYESAGKYAKPFDGVFRGKALPAGVYYYRIDLRADCAPLGGSLTLLR